MAQVPASETDSSLVARARRGDKDAFAELMARWQRPLLARALRWLPNIEDADDLVQETFFRVWQGLKRFREDQAFGAFSLRTLENLLIDRRRRLRKEEPGGEEAASRLPDQRPNPEEALLASDLAEAIERALEQIPPGRKREVFKMRFVDGMPVQEIATTLGLHSGTIKTHLFRLSRELRRRISGREE